MMLALVGLTSCGKIKQEILCFMFGPDYSEFTYQDLKLTVRSEDLFTITIADMNSGKADTLSLTGKSRYRAAFYVDLYRMQNTDTIYYDSPPKDIQYISHDAKFKEIKEDYLTPDFYKKVSCKLCVPYDFPEKIWVSTDYDGEAWQSKEKVCNSYHEAYFPLSFSEVTVLLFKGIVYSSRTTFYLDSEDIHYELCTFPRRTILYDNEIVIDDYVSSFSWNKKYIVANSRPSIFRKEKYYYYIVERCEPDTMIWGDGVYIDRKPWTLEKFQTKQEFSDRIEQLNIDTTQMKHWPSKQNLFQRILYRNRNGKIL